jgi:hypothetical protein
LAGLGNNNGGIESGGYGGGNTYASLSAWGNSYSDLLDGLRAGWADRGIGSSINNFGILSWWTDADGAQYGQYNMMKFATPSDDKWEGGSYGAITGFSSYLAGLIGSTNETFYSFSGGTNDPDKETLNKLRPHDKIEANNMFEYIINGYGRAIKAVNVSPDRFQAGIDGLSIVGLPDIFKRNDSIWIHSTIYDPYPHDTMKYVPFENFNIESAKLNNAAKAVNDKNYRNGWHFKTYGW